MLVIALAALCCGLIPQSRAVRAQANDPAEERRQLEATRYQSEEAKRDALKRREEIKAEIARLQHESEALKVQSIGKAQSVQAREAKLTEIEARLGELDAQENIIRGSLDEQRGSLSRLLASMQRMGRNPPPVIVTGRDDMLATFRRNLLAKSAFPVLEGKASALSGQLGELVRVMAASRSEQNQLRAETTLLNQEREQLAAVVERNKKIELERQQEYEQQSKFAAELGRNVTTVTELIAKLDKSGAAKSAQAAYERQLAAEQQARAGDSSGSSSGGGGLLEHGVGQSSEGGTAPQPKRLASIAKPADELRPSITLQPGERMSMAAPGRIQPAFPFEQAKGHLLLPAQGRQIQGFGDKAQSGRSDGIVIETRAGAQVVAPNDGWIMYAGEFRSYGQILIINAGGGYHILLAGLSQIDVQVGQFVLTGEPIGLMVAAPKSASVKTQETAPVLYVEIRKNQRPIDPGPWWAEIARKVAG